MPALSLHAGPLALQHLQQHGLRQEHIKVMVGASGGPKWFVLYGLDRYLFGEFFAQRQEPLALLGSSAGAWRMACLALANPVAAIDRLATHYSEQRYSERPDRNEISREAQRLLDLVLGESGAEEIVRNPVLQLHIVADRARGLVSSEQRLLLSAGLLLCGVSNAISRKTLRWHFERVIFHNAAVGACAFQPHDMPTRLLPLTPGNVRDALMASGSIPLAMQGVSDIAGAPAGIYRDGGITDYHFDMPFYNGEGLVLYPHFYPRVIPGWFDKLLPWRRADPRHYANVLLLAPSAEFVSGLPYAKIPDRKDFEKLDYDTRIKYWHKVLDESRRLADEFAEMQVTGLKFDQIKNL